MSKKSNMISAPSMDKDYQSEDDHRTLTRAEEIRMDAGRMKGVQRHQQKSLKALSRIGRTLGKRSMRRGSR